MTSTPVPLTAWNGTSHARARRWLARLAALAFAALLLYPFSGMNAGVGPWQWTGAAGADALASVRTSLLLTALAMLAVIVLGTPMALYIRKAARWERLAWQAVLLLSMLLPALALGILLTLSLRPEAAVGALLWRFGLVTSNSAAAFVITQVYVSIGYYVLAAVVALESIPPGAEQQAALLGHRPGRVFVRITLPLALPGLVVALSLAWARAIGEFGAVVVTAYYPAGMPVQIWVDLQSRGLGAVMPLLLIFLLVALPLPLAAHILARRRHA
ncbi:MAG: ABC transporter permease subunit [Terriglobales bacterium]